MKPTILSIFFLTLSLFSCKKFVQIPSPQDLITSATVFSSDASATAAVRGMYSQMVNSSGGFASGGNPSITFNCALSGDELVNYATDPTSIAFYTNGLTATNFASLLWSDPYRYILNANAVLEGLASSSGVSAGTKNELTGEAKFIRAFCNFYLVNLFGDVPLALSTNYAVNAAAQRTPAAAVYQQIIADLTDAQHLLSPDFSYSGGERDQPNQMAATAMLARSYLYTGRWDSAVMAASAVIDDSAIYSLCPDLDSVFLKNSTEAIWQLQPIGGTINTNEGYLFILTSAPTYISIGPNLLTAFEPGDNRRTHWIDSIVVGSDTYFFPYKYKVQTSPVLSEYSMVLRLAEQFLIRAEAEAQLNQLAAAATDLNRIRSRAGLPDISLAIGGSQTGLLNAILHERQVELFTEWGHRWLDLKRVGAVDSVLGSPVNVCSQKGGTWNPHQQRYPLPHSELLADPNLTQNDGY